MTVSENSHLKIGNFVWTSIVIYLFIYFAILAKDANFIFIYIFSLVIVQLCIFNPSYAASENRFVMNADQVNLGNEADGCYNT